MHLGEVRLEQVGTDRVRVLGISGSAPPPTTKLAITAEAGYDIAISIYLTGLDVDAKYELLHKQIEEVTASLPLSRLRIDRIGVPAEDPADQWAAAQQVLVTGQARDREAVDLAAFVQPIVGLILESFPGFYVIPVRRTQRIEGY